MAGKKPSFWQRALITLWIDSNIREILPSDVRTMLVELRDLDQSWSHEISIDPGENGTHCFDGE